MRRSSGQSNPLRPALGSVALAVLVLGLGGCASRGEPKSSEELFAQALDVARSHQEAGQEAEAAVLVNALSAVAASHAGVETLVREIDPATLERMQRGALGINRKLRPRVQRPIWQRVLLFLPDRLLDTADVLSFGVHFGAGAFADVHLTRAVQTGAGIRTTRGLGLHDHRSLGMKAQAEAGVSAFGAGTQSYVGTLMGSSGMRSVDDRQTGAHRPSSPLYREFRDYWALGASVTAGIVGIEVDLHPLQILDLLAGWIGLDPLNDDLSRSQALRLADSERSLIAELGRLPRQGRADAKAGSAQARPRPRPAFTPAHSLLPAPPEEPVPAAPEQ